MNDRNPPRPLIGPPAFLDRRRYRLLLVAVLLVPFFVPIPRSLQYDPLISELGDRAHVVLLGGVVFFLYWFGPLRGHPWRAALVAALIGGAIEPIQMIFGRHPLWHDFFQDLIGIGIATGYLWWRSRGSRPGLVLMTVLVLVVPWQMRGLPAKLEAIAQAAERFPVLGDFENPGQEILWRSDYDATIEIVPRDDGDEHMLRVVTEPIEKWPGAGMHRFPTDWSGYERLLVDVRASAAGADTIRGGVILSDWPGQNESSWSTWRAAFTPQWRTIEVPLHGLRIDQMERDLDLSDMFSVKVFLTRPSERTTLEIDNVRLE